MYFLQLPFRELLAGLRLGRVPVLGLGLHRGRRGRGEVDARVRLVVNLVDQVVGLQDLRVGMGGHRRMMQCVVAVLVVLVGVGGRRRGVLGVVDLSVDFVAIRDLVLCTQYA